MAEVEPGRWDRRFAPWVDAVLIAALSRVFASAVLAVSAAARIPEPIRTWNSPFLIWDAEWYVWIAQYGYHAVAPVTTPFGVRNDFAFWPVWPGVIAAVHWITRVPVQVIGPVASSLIFIVAAVPVYRVMRQLWPRSIARLGLLLFAFSPPAYAHSAAYSEPLFLLASSLFFLDAQPVRRTLLAAVGQLSRVSGFFLGVASLADLAEPAHRRRGLVTIAVVVATFGAWWLYIAILTGDPRGYLLGTPAWYAADVPGGSPTGLASILGTRDDAVYITLAFLAVLAIGTVAVFRRRVADARRLGLFSLACLASTWLATWNTMPRLAAIAFPAFVGFAAVLPWRPLRWLFVAAFAVCEAVLGARSVAGTIVP